MTHIYVKTFLVEEDYYRSANDYITVHYSQNAETKT